MQLCKVDPESSTLRQARLLTSLHHPGIPHRIADFEVLLQGPRGALFHMSEVPLYRLSNSLEFRPHQLPAFGVLQMLFAATN